MLTTSWATLDGEVLGTLPDAFEVAGDPARHHRSEFEAIDD